MALSAKLNHVQVTTNIISQKCPNRKIIRSTLEGGLYLPMITSIEGQAHISTDIKHSPVFIGALCDAECIVTFRIKYVTMIYKNNIIL